ncbi:MAG TPA: energy transducer TonB [Vicinamibacterales bacterium]|nr:energy transducer TonB [Vicinamibacterales bacterium]
MATLIADQKSPRKITDVAPVYPLDSLQRGDEAAILVELRIAPDGAVDSALLLRSACPRLNNAALVAARQWRLEPRIINGRGTPYTIIATVDFRLGARKPARMAPDACVWRDAKPLT